MTTLDCPRCGLPAAAPGLIDYIEFPTDLEPIDQLFRGRLNRFVHFCGADIQLTTPCAVTWKARRIVLAVAYPEDRLEADALADAGWSVMPLESYDALHSHVGTWVLEDFNPYWADLQQGRLNLSEPRQAIEHSTGLRLLCMKLYRDGVLNMYVPDGGTGRLRQLSDDELSPSIGLFLTLTVDQVVRTVQLAIYDGDGERLEACLLERVPIQVLDGEVLIELARRANHPTDQAQGILEAYLSRVACAVAHAATGQPNRAGPALAALMLVLWEKQETGDAVVDERLWLSPRQFRGILEAEAIEGALRARFSGQPATDFLRLAPPLLSRLGRFESFERLVQEMTAGISLGDGSAALTSIVDACIAQDPANFDDSGGQWDLGTSCGAAAWRFISGRTPTEVLRSSLARLGGAVAPATFAAFLVELIRLANAAGRYSFALQVARKVMDLPVDEECALPTHGRIAAWTEIGNCLRYAQRWDESLQTYERAQSINDSLADDDASRRARILQRNRALVLRDSGRFGEARALFEALLADDPQDPQATISLLVLLEREGRSEEVLERASASLLQRTLEPDDRFVLNLVRAAAALRLGDDEAAAADCINALSILRSERDHRWLQVATVGLLCMTEDPQLREVLDGIARKVRDRLESDLEESPGPAVSAATSAALRSLRLDRTSEAGDLLDRFEAALNQRGARLPWQAQFARGWEAHKRGDPEAFGILVGAVSRFDASVPAGLEGVAAVGLLNDWATDEIQRLACRAGIEAVMSGRADPSELVPLLDISRGRDLTARAVTRAEVPSPGDPTFARLATLGRQGCDVVAVVDEGPTLLLLLEPAGGDPHLVDSGVGIDEVSAAVAAIRAFDRVNPAVPAGRDERLAAWWRLADVLAEVIRSHLDGQGELVLLPGRLLSGAPFHAVGWPRRPLIADRPVSIGVNHRMLAGSPRRSPGDRGTRGVLAIPRRGDDERFVSALRAASAELGGQGTSITSFGTEADRSALLSLMESSDELFLLCHGVYAGPRLGPAVCVSSDGALPPDIIEIGLDPGLDAFAVSWRDLATLRQAPDLLVSIACSSGRTAVGRGGSRLGLEQGSLANGSRFVIAPLWNVEQASAVSWVAAFSETLKSRADSRGYSEEASAVSAAHRQATLAVMDTWPHPFHWAPFALTTALRGASNA